MINEEGLEEVNVDDTNFNAKSSNATPSNRAVMPRRNN
jgi:hypothetical protein